MLPILFFETLDDFQIFNKVKSLRVFVFCADNNDFELNVKVDSFTFINTLDVECWFLENLFLYTYIKLITESGIEVG